jgi:hypothetical protein
MQQCRHLRDVLLVRECSVEAQRSVEGAERPAGFTPIELLRVSDISDWAGPTQP